MPETRKIAAILAADIVGYSRLASVDEDRTLARLRTLRSDLIDPTIAVHYGRVVKRTGDGILVEFRSVVDAVRCAIEVQNSMVERNAGVPLERLIRFRIGIHLGDVVEESDGDLMGTGVNIAARLEGIATPGAICISEDAYRQVKGRLDLAVTDLGEIQLKNIVEPVRVYALAANNSDEAPVPPERQRLTLPDKPSIAVLPFQNISGDPEQGYFADGVVEDIITAISCLKSLFVIALVIQALPTRAMRSTSNRLGANLACGMSLGAASARRGCAFGLHANSSKLQAACTSGVINSMAPWRTSLSCRTL
jgi:class 3 adenylate cyclase